jgi:nucleoside-diphosphate-sugar epimerase
VNHRNFHANPGGPVLVAGAGGFIGRRLVALLRRSEIDLHPVGTQECDLRRLGETRLLLETLRPSVIVNLARPTHAAGPSSEHRGHAEIASNLMTAARASGVRRLIQLGSSTEFGDAESPVDDDAPLRPNTPFGRAKADASSLVLAADSQGLRTTVLRPFSVYGPGDLRRHLIPAAIDAALSGRRLPVASGVRRDWVFVDDVALGCALALDGRADGIPVNLASGLAVSNEQVVELVGDATGRAIDADRGAMPARPWDTGVTGSTERARGTLGWAARTEMREGIRMTLAADGPSERESRVAAAR